MKTITYYFNDGTTSTVEVSDELYTEIEKLQEEEISNNRSETRRHVSLEAVMDKKMDFADGVLIEDIVNDTLFEDKLLQESFDELPAKQQDLIKKVFFDGWKIRDLATEMGITENALSKRFQRALKKLQKIFCKNGGFLPISWL